MGHYQWIVFILSVTVLASTGCFFLFSDSLSGVFEVFDYRTQSSSGNELVFSVNSQEDDTARRETGSSRMDQGMPFNASWMPYLEELKLTESSVDDIDDHKVLQSRPVIVTAASSNHFKEFKKNILSNKNLKLSTSRPLVVYDLGLSKIQVSELRQKHNISVVTFNFSKYPTYVKKLFEYRWKPLLMAESLLRYPSIWYIDASIYFKTSTDDNEVTNVFDQIRNGSYPSHFSTLPSAFSIHSTVDPGIYNYLPLGREENKHTKQSGGGSQIVFGTKDTRLTTMKWYVLCALEKNCMGSTKYGLYCNFKAGSSRIKDFGKCHRFDQSALSLILGARHGYRVEHYSKDMSFIDVRRG